jgi:DNA repair protein RecN (Recombination protein N)
MLDELIVTNLGIIDTAHLEPGPGLVVITGETGAGKTMLLGALRMLLGASSRRELVGPSSPESVVDGRFLFGDDEVTLRRRVTSEGRSKAYIDGNMVPARALQEKTDGRVEVVGQHDHMLLTTRRGARRLVDGALGGKALAEYEAAWDALVVARQQLELLGGGRRELERELEVVRFQAEEIAAAGFAPGEDTELHSAVSRMRNSEDLAAGLGAILERLGDERAAADLAGVASELRRLVRLDGELQSFQERVEDIAAALGELQMDLAAYAEELEHDPGLLDELENRIQVLGELGRKYGESLDEVLEFGAAAEARAAELTQLLGRAEDLADELAERTEQAERAADTLTKARRKAAKKLATRAREHLAELGMADPVVRFEFADSELGPTGGDQIELLFSSDASLTAAPVSRIASGGELSRLTLALRLAAGVAEADLIAFDEVDAGVGGATALAMGEKLAALSRGRQIFCVTHLPQVAAHADSHFVVDRDNGRAVVSRVAGDDRLAELSRMLGGLADSERGQLHAAELLAAAGGSADS